MLLYLAHTSFGKSKKQSKKLGINLGFVSLIFGSFVDFVITPENYLKKSLFKRKFD
tara:strand:+ start:70069 stop:70236 length:168 start_codon:yes stop_codon:yes gene_type:complete